MLTKVVNLEFEEKCLQRYEEIVSFILRKLEATTSLETDLKILDQNQQLSDMTANEYFAVVYRSEMKKIMRAQKEIVDFVQNVLKQSQSVNQAIQDGKSTTEASKIFKGIYLAKMESEKNECDEKGEFKNEESESWYLYRRLRCRKYL